MVPAAADRQLSSTLGLVDKLGSLTDAEMLTPQRVLKGLV